MDKYKSTKVSFGNGPTSSPRTNQVTPLDIQQQNSKQWIPPDAQEPSSNRYSRNISMKHIDNNKRKCSKALLISFGVLLFFVVSTALAINIYLLIFINNRTTTTNSTTSTSKVCVNGDTIITFDNLTISAAVPNGYNNILWSNAYVYSEAANRSGYYTGTVSSPNIIYNGGGNPMTIQSATGRFLSFYSAAIAAAWNDNLQLTIIGYKSNLVIINNTFTLQVFTVSYLTFTQYTGLDTIIFTTFGGTKNAAVNGSGIHFAMDNICFSFT